MKVVILAGGFGTRISEESHLKPKPMIEIGERPILWHIMKIYSHYGFNDFIICLGYKGHIIKEYFAEYYLHASDVTFDMVNNQTITHSSNSEPWRVTCVNTGLNTMTGGRVRRIQKFVGDEPFMLTYGDGVSDVDISKLLKFHRSHGRLATITTVQPGGRFGVPDIDEETGLIRSFREKTKDDGGWINGGFMVLQPEVFRYLKDDSTVFEREPLESLAAEGQLCAYQHRGFWQCMDTQRDKLYLESLLSSGKAPWKKWE